MRHSLTVLLLAAATFACNSGKNSASAPVVAAPTTAPAAASTLSGKLLERIDASPYSYLRIQSAAGEIWAAVPETKLEKGADVTLANPMLMNDFESKTLKRKFPQIYFGNLAPAGGAAAAPAPAGMAAEAPMEVGKVEKAAGPDGRTIGEAWAQKGSLKGKTVSIRGKVVKYNAGILGKNWLHLQDGSGDAKSGTHDITVTTKDDVAKGQTVTVQGVLNLDKDFGSGYAYAVIVEDAKVKK